MKEIKPLYRRVNTKALNYSINHNGGSDAKYDRNTKKGVNKSMKKNVNRGLDYTPLFMYLLSKIGEDWNNVYSKAVKRLDKDEPIFWMVAINESEKEDIVRVGNSYYNGLYVDEYNKLQKVDPTIKNEDFMPSCSCCTKTFNGKKLNRKHNNDDTTSIRL